MTNKKILSIDIDDEKFKAFYEQWKEFNVDLEDMPAEWKELGESVAQSHEALAAAAGVLLENMNHASLHAKDLVDHLKEAAASQKDFKSATVDSEITLKKMGKEAKEFADSIFNVGKFLMKLDVIGGVTGIGSLWGIDKLANGAIETQRQARGLGLTTGQLKAFQTDFGERYIDEGTLSSIADARGDLSKQWAIRKTTGLSQSQIDQTDVGTLAAKMAISAHDWWASTPDSEHNIQFAKAKGFLDAGNSFDQVRQWGNTDRGELNRALMQYHQDASQLNIGSGNTDVLYDFKRQLTLAGQILETDFSDKLADLNRSGALSGFIHALSDDAKVLVDDVLKPENLNKIKDAIDDFTKYLGSDEVKKNIVGFGEDVKTLGEVVASTAKFIAALFPDAGITPNDKDTTSDEHNPNSNAVPDPDNVGANSKFWHPYNFASGKSVMGTSYITDQYVGPGFESINPDNPDAQKNLAFFKSLELQNGLPSGVVGALAYDESKGDAHALSPTGAAGLMQLTKATAADMGVTDRFDFTQSAKGGAKYFGQLYKNFGGDGGGIESLEKAIAAYHDGLTAFNRETKGSGKDWMSHVSMEGQGEVLNVMKQMAKYRQANVNITITNKAGTDVAVQTNAGSF